MFARTHRYAAAYTHKEPSRDAELHLLLDWIAAQPGHSLTLFGPAKETVGHSALASSLVNRRIADYFSDRQMGSAVYRCHRAIALWPDVKQLGKIHDNGHQLTALGVLTWSLKDVDPWASAVSADDLLKLGVPKPVEFDDDVVRGAMRSLTNAVNLSSGLGHPLDWDKAVLTFRLLKRRGHFWDPSQVERWAIANGWDAHHAADLREVADAYSSGRSKMLKARSQPFAAHVLGHWRQIGSQSGWTPV